MLARNSRFKASEFAFVGEQHNQFVDSVKTYMIKDSIKEADFLLFAERKINSDIEVTYKDSLDLEKDLVHQTILTKPDDSKHIIDFLPSQTFPHVRPYLESLENIVMSDTLDVSEITSNIEQLEDNAYNDKNLTNDDLAILFPATSVAKSSIDYWNIHLVEWDSYANHTSSKGTPPGKRIARIAAMDVGGAVAGAAGAWAVNVVVGPGQVAYAGAIVGTAVTTSVCQTAYEIFSSIFGD
jgi:hypothetical protein